MASDFEPDRRHDRATRAPRLVASVQYHPCDRHARRQRKDRRQTAPPSKHPVPSNLVPPPHLRSRPPQPRRPEPIGPRRQRHRHAHSPTERRPADVGAVAAQRLAERADDHVDLAGQTRGRDRAAAAGADAAGGVGLVDEQAAAGGGERGQRARAAGRCRRPSRRRRR